VTLDLERPESLAFDRYQTFRKFGMDPLVAAILALAAGLEEGVVCIQQ